MGPQLRRAAGPTLQLQCTMPIWGDPAAGYPQRLSHSKEPALPDRLSLVQGMAGGQFGIWCAHGEGRVTFPDPHVKAAVLRDSLAPIRWAAADDCGKPLHLWLR